MILERVEIVGFRGINRLSLMLEQNNVLIGENAWGKSSLLDALTLLLSPESDLYHFERDDFWFPPGDINGREHHLHIILTFRESLPGRHRVRRYRPLEACWTPCTDGYHRIFYRLEGESAEDGSVMTLRSFLDKDGHPIDVEDINDQARHLVRLMPVSVDSESTYSTVCEPSRFWFCWASAASWFSWPIYCTFASVAV